MFYIEFDSDLNILREYNAKAILEHGYCFELNYIFEQELLEVIQKRKKYTDEILFGQPVYFKDELTFEKLNLNQYLYLINNFASRKLIQNLAQLELLRLNGEKKSIHEVLKFYHELAPEYLKLFNPDIVSLGEKKIYPFSYLCINHMVEFIVQLTVDDEKILLAGYREQGRKRYMVVGGDFIDREYDTLIPYLIKNDIENLNIESIQLKKPDINLMGDTYFGEKYTERRKKRNVEDALTKYGYSYSFLDIAPFFRKDDFNIVNFEAVFNIRDFSPLDGRKDFILGAHSGETRKELKNNHIDVVCLANNHALDYGENSFISTLHDFIEDDFIVLGGGYDQYQANKILELEYRGKKIAIFNGYWNKVNAYIDYEFYALNERAGINILNGVMLYQIKLYKKLNPDHTILCFCHWGIDFKPVHPYQERVAKRLLQVGADVIVGHGPHTIQKIEKYQEKFIIYSVGNGIFNSNGEYEKQKALPYGFLTRINILNKELQLYPIFTNNLKTFWKPRFVTEDEFIQLKAIYKEDSFITDKDELGFFFKLQL
ncbi:CapA family protein [Acinetobacter sp. VNK23]|uniref:CapA family protein n=1 Tax=Acinetobacter thutiue TaxID=2998078 RepID=UPI002577BCDB|nr:CapA family protein [Acinetobacter thutiue]MDM1019470.1 CapA family protein [Acinetobacter thutiue]